MSRKSTGTVSPGTGGTILAALCSREESLPSPPWKDEGDDRALDMMNDIQSMDAGGVPRAEIARRPGVSRNTVAKYADIEDMSPVAPAPAPRSRPRSSAAQVARYRRARLPATGPRRRAAALSGVRERLRAAVGGYHHEPGFQLVGRVVRRRPDGGGHNRTHRPSREACPIQGRVPPRAQRAYAEGVGAQERRAFHVRKLFKNR